MMIEDHGLEYFCSNIKYIREREGLSQKEMAKALGIGVKSLVKLERGELPPRLDCMVVYYVHRNFGVKPAELFGALICK